MALRRPIVRAWSIFVRETSAERFSTPDFTTKRLNIGISAIVDEGDLDAILRLDKLRARIL
jgi:hypothetical protein